MDRVRGAWAAGMALLVGISCADDDAKPDALSELSVARDAADAGGPRVDSGTRMEPESEELEADSDEPMAGSPATPMKTATASGSFKEVGSSDAHPSEASEQDAAAASKEKNSKPEPSDAGASVSLGVEPDPELGEAADGLDAGVAMPGELEPGSSPTQQATLVGLGQRLFEDTSLSLNGTQSCASCHDAQRAFSGNADHEHPRFPVARGATEGRFGTRNAPTAMYMQFSPPFSFVEEPEEPGEFTPTGGLFWDGRVNTLSEQAAGPFLNAREMALPSKAAVIERVRQTDYVWMFEPLFGPDPLGDVDMAYQHVTDAIAAYERTDRFNPFSSKFDAFLAGKAQLSEQEQRGFDLFKDPEKANCIACHVGDPASIDSRDWLFTDFTYDNLGVPRNPEIPDNAEATHYDLGLCQSEAVLAKIPDAITDKPAFLTTLCGAFKVPTLRNVAKTAPYMHNGYFHELRDVIDFYVTRETDSARWYPHAADGSVVKYDDLPVAYRQNVNTSEVPYDRVAGEQPRLTPDEIDAVLAFLNTLSDGYDEELHEHLHAR